MAELLPILRADALTVTGQTMGDNLMGRRSPNNDVVKTLEQPFSPTGGLAVMYGNLAPESAITKPAAIAPVKDGDFITIDIPGKELTVEVVDEELAGRRAQWRRPSARVTGGYLSLYSRLASSAARGAMMTLDVLNPEDA